MSCHCTPRLLLLFPLHADIFIPVPIPHLDIIICRRHRRSRLLILKFLPLALPLIIILPTTPPLNPPPPPPLSVISPPPILRHPTSSQSSPARPRPPTPYPPNSSPRNTGTGSTVSTPPTPTKPTTTNNHPPPRRATPLYIKTSSYKEHSRASAVFRTTRVRPPDTPLLFPLSTRRRTAPASASRRISRRALAQGRAGWRGPLRR